MDSSALAAAGLGLASAPHCMGMCGPIAGVASGSRSGALAYHAARLGAYAGAGALLASLVAPVRERLGSGPVAWGAAVATAAALLASAWRLARPQGRPALVPAAALVRRDRRLATVGSLGLGALTGLLPCGALYGALGVAALSGSPARAAVSMGIFGCVSAAGLATSQLAFRALARDGDGRARRLVAAVLVVSAALTLGRPLLVGGDAAACHDGSVALGRPTEGRR